MGKQSTIGVIAAIRQNANDFIVRRMAELGLEGLAVSHGDILGQLIFHGDGMTMADLAERIRRDKSTITALVRKLEAGGFIRKEKDLDDARITRVWLTDKSMALRSDFELISYELITKAYGGFNEKESEECYTYLTRILDNFRH